MQVHILGAAIIGTSTFWRSCRYFRESLIAGFGCLAAVARAALLVPLSLMSFVSILSRSSRGIISQWIWADTRQQIQPMSLALMALMLALAANVGVSTMVGSFRSTFTGWLDQRLASDLYITTRTPAEAVAFQEFVSAEVDSILPIVSADVRLLDRQDRFWDKRPRNLSRTLAVATIST